MPEQIAAPDEHTSVPLLAPREGVPAVISSPEEIKDAAAALAAGTGPLAVDAERASGFRYSARAYLIQLRREGSGTILLDPIPNPGALGPLAAAINGLEWVLHSADQDLPGLAELDLAPAALYDTELAGRLAGLERVGLAAIVEQQLGLELRKGHGAADWSTRPLPDNWLNYAALDVEVLLELQQALRDELARQRKTEFAAQEFEHIRTMGPSVPKPERWRRTSQIHTIHSRRQLAAVRALWHARDNLAASKDIAPGRVLPDAAIIAAATADPRTIADLRALPVFGGPRQRRDSERWMRALIEARRLDDSELPSIAQQLTGPPPVNRWSRRNPEAGARLDAARSRLSALSKEVAIPVENLLTPEYVRRVCWNWDDLLEAQSPSGDPAIDYAGIIGSQLRADGARPWQLELTVPILAEALASATADLAAATVAKQVTAENDDERERDSASA